MPCWRCPICGSNSAAIDYSGEEPEFIGCLECDWHKIVKIDRRCTQPTTKIGGGYRGRCSRWAVVNGQCWQHADKEGVWETVYARFRNGAGDDIPEAYREIFRRACLDAGLLAREERNEQRRIQELEKRATKLHEKSKSSVIYFIRRDNLIKIGVTTNLRARLKAISKGGQMPAGMTVGPVELLATRPGDRAVESALHGRFHEHRIEGTEWFRPCPELLDLIDKYKRQAEEATTDAAA